MPDQPGAAAGAGAGAAGTAGGAVPAVLLPGVHAALLPAGHGRAPASPARAQPQVPGGEGGGQVSFNTVSPHEIGSLDCKTIADGTFILLNS